MRLLIVDDGQYIVEYLKHLLDWQKLGIDQVKTTTNPIEAKNILENTSVDILLTDIRMPEISGVGLLKWIHERQLSCKVIFLSGYSDFEYSQSAIRYGAADYLLKPVDKDEMEKTILRAVQSIKQNLAMIDTEPSELDGISLLFAVLTNNKLLNNRLSLVSPAMSSNSFVFMKSSNPSEKTKNTLQDISKKTVTGFVRISDRSPSRIMALLPTFSYSELFSRNSEIICSDLFLLHEKNKAISEFMRFYYGEKVGLADFVFLRSMLKDLTLQHDQLDRNRSIVEKKFLDCQSRCRQILFLIEIISQLNTMVPGLDPYQVSDWLFSLDEPELLFVEIMVYVSQTERNTVQMPKPNIVEVIKAYILGHIDKPLNLNEIGNLVHLHPVYLSKYYKQETGENLSSFLLAQRMEKAAKLLEESSLHVVDISKMVGYKKTQHFIKLFKEQYGTTPYQYRRINIK
ncbi:putative response regulatory protein [compost metagenome]